MNKYRLIFKITKTHMLTRIKQSSIAALGVTFGIGAFIILVSFMTGLNGLLDGLILNSTPHIAIYNEIKPSEKQPIDISEEFKNSFNVVQSIKPKSNQLKIHNALPIINKLKKDQRVRGVTAQTAANVFYLAGSNTLNGVITGINVEEEQRLFSFGDYIIEGRPENLNKDKKGILLGAGIAKKLSLALGDKIQITTAAGGRFPLRIVGIFQSGLAEIDNIHSYVQLSTAQQIMGKNTDYITAVNVKLWDLEKAYSMSKEVGSQYNITAIDINTANAQFETGTTIRNMITYSVSITLLVVAGFGIYNILNMLIYEKMNDIAILKATGFSGKDVRDIFLGQALMIGTAGGLLGLLFGFGVSVLISHTPFETEALPTIKTFPVNFSPWYYVIGISFALVSTFFAGYLPAKKAQKIDPVEIIRGQ